MKLILEIETNDRQSVLDAKAVLGALFAEATTTTQDVPAPEKPKATPRKPKVSPTKSEVTPEPKKAPEASKKQEGISLGDLKDRAKKVVGTAGRDAVKELIGKYAPKLTEVSTEDYGKLYKSLGEL